MHQTVSRHIRFRGKSFPALVLEPDNPLSAWFERLDAYLACSPAFFRRKAIVIDVGRLGLERSALAEMLQMLNSRGVRVLGLAGVEPDWASDDLPPIFNGGREEKAVTDSAALTGKHSLTPQERASFDEIAAALSSPADAEAKSPLSGSMSCEGGRISPHVVDAPVRSGQTIFYPQGDIVVIGSVSSGADVIAGGSIHVYGALRGRAMAGAYGDTRARIFCRRLEAELLAVGGYYLTTDQIQEKMLRQNVQIWLERDDVKIARLD